MTIFNPTIARITLRGLLGRKRSLLLIPLPLVLLFLTVVARGTGSDPKQWADVVLVVLGVGVVMPLTALIIGTSVFGSEIDDGTIVHVLTKPLPRREVVLTKYLVATGVSALVSAIALLAAGIITGSLRLGVGLAIGGVVGTVVYTALFVMASLLIRRSVLIGLAYILLWENLLGSLLSGTRVLSVQQYALTIADRVSGSPLLTSHVSLPTSITLCAAFTVVPLLLSIDRLRSFSLAGETS